MTEGTITIRKDALWKYSTFALLGIFLVGAIMFIIPNNPTSGNVVANPSAGNVNVVVSEDDHFVKGNIDSKVKVVEWSDFECPFCRDAFNGALAQIKSKYSDEDVAIVYRQFPLASRHQYAQKAAEASECAGEQGKFKEMHDMLFISGVEGGAVTFKGYASQLGLNSAQFDSCLDSGKYTKEISEDLKEGKSAGISGTPGFVIIGEDGKGTLVSGAQKFITFQQIIDSKL